MSRCCSQCGTNGHNSRTCGESSTAVSGMNGGGSGGGEIMLFGVRVKVDPMRKSVSMNNLSQYEQPPLPMVNLNGAGSSDSKNNCDESEKAADDAVVVVGGGGGYVSADDAVQHQSTGGRERKRGIPWTEEEHKLFLLGLQNVGKGDWRGISRNFVKTRTPTQVASHAQKYYLRKTNLNRRRRRSSLFDITTDSVPSLPIEDGRNNKEQTVLQPTSMPSPTPPATSAGAAAVIDASNMNGYTIGTFPMAVGPILVPVQVQNSLDNKNFQWVDQVQKGPTMLLHPFPVIPIATSSASTDIINRRGDIDPSALTLRLSLSSDYSQSSTTRQPSYKAVGNFRNGDNMVSVA